MFGIKSRMEVFVPTVLIAAILFNALALNPIPAQAEQDIVPSKAGQLKSRSMPTFPTFERPQERITGRDEQHTQLPVFLSTSAQAYISNCTLGLEGLCLANDWWPLGDANEGTIFHFISPFASADARVRMIDKDTPQVYHKPGGHA